MKINLTHASSLFFFTTLLLSGFVENCNIHQSQSSQPPVELNFHNSEENVPLSPQFQCLREKDIIIDPNNDKQKNPIDLNQELTEEAQKACQIAENETIVTAERDHKGFNIYVADNSTAATVEKGLTQILANSSSPIINSNNISDDKRTLSSDSLLQQLGVDFKARRDCWLGLSIIPIGLIGLPLVQAVQAANVPLNPKRWPLIKSIFPPIFNTGILDLPTTINTYIGASFGEFPAAVLSAPITEEVQYRLIVQHGLFREIPKTILKQRGFKNAKEIVDHPIAIGSRILLTSLLFAFCHRNYQDITLQFAGGLIYGAIMEYTNSIFPSLFMHSIYNSLIQLSQINWTNLITTNFGNADNI